jgi:hypothetical protein
MSYKRDNRGIDNLNHKNQPPLKGYWDERFNNFTKKFIEDLRKEKEETWNGIVIYPKIMVLQISFWTNLEFPMVI